MKKEELKEIEKMINDIEAYDYSDSTKKIMDKIKKLLSQEAFTKGELNGLKKIGEELFVRGYRYEDKEIEILEKVDKLLK